MDLNYYLLNMILRSMLLRNKMHGYGLIYRMTKALMVIPVQMETQATEKAEYLALLFTTEFLISIRSSKMARFQKTINFEDSLELLPDPSIAGVISALLMGLSLDFLRKAEKLSEQILSMEKQMNNDADSIKIEEISRTRSELLILESIAQGQLPIIEAVIISKRAAIISENTQEYLVWTAANLKAADRKIDWLEHRIEIMSTLIDMKAQEKTNRRLGRLTVVSMIFMPITFLAGVWGMNFEFMPLLSLRFGYIVALFVMIIITVSMYFYYRRKGWFR